MKRHNRRLPGFTIVEVGVAILVIGLLLSTILQLHTQIIRTVNAAQQRISHPQVLWNAWLYAQRQPWYYEDTEQRSNMYEEDDLRVTYERQEMSQAQQLQDYAQVGRLEQFTLSDGVSQEAAMAYL